MKLLSASEVTIVVGSLCLLHCWQLSSTDYHVSVATQPGLVLRFTFVVCTLDTLIHQHH